MLDRASLIIRGRSEQTKKRQQTDILLKKAMRGNKQAKLKLYKEFGIKLYSSNEVDKYVQERLFQEYTSGGKGANNGPSGLTLKRKAKGLSQDGAESRLRQDRKSSTSRAKSRGRTKQLVKKV
jgi:hypothetical protein